MPIECVQIPPGTVLAGYRIESELGRGNNGVVYLAEQQSLGRQVAFKILLPELAAEPGYVENFLREARFAARLDHPYIVQAYDAGATPEGYYYFAMELVIGPSLEDVRRDMPEQLTFELMFRLSVELAEALDYAWNVHKMTHGDIKPGNLLISDETGRLKLTDLGLARVSGSRSGDDIMATPLYAAPEVIRGEHADFGVKSDLYSFGIMLYELLCGSPPFVGSPQKVLEQHLYRKPQPLAERNPDLDPGLIAFVERLIDKDPARRPDSWLEVRDFLAGRLESLRSSAPLELREIEPPEARRKRRFRALIFVLVAIALLAALGAAVYLAIRMTRFDPAPLAVAPPSSAVRPASLPVPAEESAPELSVRLSSPAATAPPPFAAPVRQDAAPAPEKVAEPAQLPEKPSARRRGFFSFDPPIDEAVLRTQTELVNRLFLRFGSRLSDDWRTNAVRVTEASYRLLMQLDTVGLPFKSIDRVDLLSGGQGGADWISNGPHSGVLRITPESPPILIAGELGRGFFEANRQKYDLPNNLRDEFSEAFRFFVAQRLGAEPQPSRRNRVLRICHHSLAAFTLMFRNERMLRQLREGAAVP